jgi:hypothetical protein
MVIEFADTFVANGAVLGVLRPIDLNVRGTMNHDTRTENGK